MAVTSTNNRIEYLNVDGVQTAFDYPFRILDASQLQVFDDGVLVSSATYVVTGVGVSTGGKVTFTVAPTAGHDIVIVRIVAFDQQKTFPLNGNLPSTQIEEGFDKATMLLQQLAEVDRRTVKLALTSLFKDVLLEDPVVGRFLRWKNTQTVEGADITALGSLGLPVSTANGGTGVASAGTEANVLTSVAGGWASGAPGRVRLTNRSGAQRTAGDVVVPSTANDQSFSTTTTPASSLPVLVVNETIEDAATGYLHQRGVVTAVKVQGNVARYDFLGTSTTAGRAGSLGSTKVTGAFGLALSAYGGGGAGTVIALLFGDTHLAASIPGYSDAAARDNLVMTWATAATFTVTADGVKMLDGSGNSRIKRSLSVTADITTTGLNGRDTATAEAGSKWYWVWAVSNGTTDGVLLVPDGGGGSPTAPSTSIYAWTYSLLLGAVYNDASSDLRKFVQVGSLFSWAGDSTDGPPIVFTAKTGVTSYTAESIAAFIPPHRVARVFGTRGASSALITRFAVAPNSAGEHADVMQLRADGTTVFMGWHHASPWSVPWLGGTDLYWRVGTTSAVYRLGVRGFEWRF